LVHVGSAIPSERLARLRQAIQNRRVSFPAQVPSFQREYSAEIQWRVVTLYFIRGWTCEQLAARYGVTASRVRQLLRRWVECAAALGYLQEIPPETLIAARSENAAAA
jgi:transposase-like protein